MSVTYEHTQSGPWAVLLYGLAVLFGAVFWSERHEIVVAVLMPLLAVLMLVLAPCFHYLRVVDEGDALLVHFGPLPLFRRRIRYDEMRGVDVGRTLWLDGWGIHASLRGGWVWNIWGRECVVIQLERSIIRIGTDDAPTLAAFLQTMLPPESPGGCDQ